MLPYIPADIGQADDEDQDDGQDHCRPAEYQTRQRQASPLFSGALYLVPGHMADTIAGMVASGPKTTAEPAGQARYREPVDLARRGHHPALRRQVVTIWSRSA